jgi:hypothetical protein
MNSALIFAVVGGLVVIAGVAYALERNAKRAGNLLSEKNTAGRRVFAALLGLIMLGFPLFEYLTAPRIHLLPLFFALPLLAYALGIEKLLPGAKHQ